MASKGLLSKLVNKRTRGTMFAFRGFFSSIFMTTFNGTAGYLYDNVSKREPFLIVAGVSAATYVLILSFGFTGKIR